MPEITGKRHADQVRALLDEFDDHSATAIRAAAALLLFPYVLLLLIVVGYVCVIPFTIRSQRWVAARPETWNDKPGQRRQARREIRRAAQPHRRSMSRLGLRKPQGRK